MASLFLNEAGAGTGVPWLGAGEGLWAYGGGRRCPTCPTLYLHAKL